MIMHPTRDVLLTSGLQHYHAWRLWKIELPVDAEGWLEFCVRSWDSSNNTEPTFVRSAWKYAPTRIILPRSFSDCRLQLGSARHLILPPHQDLQCQQVETRHRRPSGRDRGQGRQLQPAHHAARVEPRERGRLPQEHAEAPSRAPQLDRPVEHLADLCMIHVVSVIIVILKH